MKTSPRSNRLHIALFGKRNSGKSSLINALTNQNAALVSDIAGTTTDPVYQPMEIHGIGPCVFIDTAGFDDEGELGSLRIERTLQAADKADIALMVCCDTELSEEQRWIELLKERNIPYLLVLNKADLLEKPDEVADKLEQQTGQHPLIVSAKEKTGIDSIRQSILHRLPELNEQPDIVGDLANEGDVVLLVMPQDIQAPKGRLILPQVQTLRELLDKKCITLSCTTDQLDNALKVLSAPPSLIITDSQVFRTVYEKKPPQSRLTSFSVLFARYKGAVQKYRYCFEGRKFRFDRYDKMFVYEKAEESVLMASKIAVTRLQYPKGLWESAKKEYEKFLMENLYEVLLGTLEDPETIKWIAGQYLTPEKNPLTADKMSGLITEISKKHLPELLGMFMEIQRKKFGVKKKKLDFV